MVYAVCKCANEIEAFRYRFLDGKVVLYDKIDASFTYLNKETELFKVVNVPLLDNIRDFCETAYKTANAQKEYFKEGARNDVFQCSPIPWFTYTSISHTLAGKTDNAAPVFDWGKYYEKDGGIKMMMSAQAHHSFVDGIHIAKFIDKIQAYFDNFTLDKASQNQIDLP